MTFGHASGFNWDEALLVFVPLALLAVIVVGVRARERRRSFAERRGDDEGS